jgi:hypothetical protein
MLARYRTRYFADSGIIGSKELVSINYQRFKHLFYSKDDKKPRSIKGLEGLYSLKRLSDVFVEATVRGHLKKNQLFTILKSNNRRKPRPIGGGLA